MNIGNEEVAASVAKKVSDMMSNKPLFTM